MSKVIVSIVSEQTVPNYLFIQEKLKEAESKEGYELLFISSEKFKSKIDLFSKVLNKKVDSVILAPDAEEKWNEMKEALEEHLCDEKEYLVNLTGGTKYMTLLVYSVFESKKASFYYIPYPKNEILRPGQGRDKLKYRMNVEEYFNIHEVNYKNKKGKETLIGKEPVKTKGYTENFFEKFIYDTDKKDHKVLKDLQKYRRLDKDIPLGDIEKGTYTDYPKIENIQEFLKGIEFPLNCNDKDKVEKKQIDSPYLEKREIEYLTGGWFEEYIYHKIKDDLKLKPKNIALNVHIKKSDKNNENELDVVFTLGNKLFAIECKTGLYTSEEEEENETGGIFKETSYKSSTIKNTTLGRLSSNVYLISLAEHKKKTHRDDEYKEMAEKMAIKYKGRNDVTEESRWEAFIEEIKKIAEPQDQKN